MDNVQNRNSYNMHFFVFDILRAVTLKSAVSYDVIPCIAVDVYRYVWRYVREYGIILFHCTFVQNEGERGSIVWEIVHVRS
jgi:hypothetical protein